MVPAPNIFIINIVTMFVKWRKPRIFCFAVSFTYITDNFKDFHIPQEHGFLRLLGIGKMFNASVGFWRRKAVNESFFCRFKAIIRFRIGVGIQNWSHHNCFEKFLLTCAQNGNAKRPSPS
jgi:hypothetical protein